MTYRIPANTSNGQNLKTTSACGLSTRATEQTNDPIPYHLHCQATVLPAWGSSEDGNGATWSVLQSLNVPYLTQRYSNWLDLFKHPGNMTHDLASIIKLINWQVEKSPRVQFILQTMGSSPIRLVTTSSQALYPTTTTQIIASINPTVDLTIHGEPVSFKTISANNINIQANVNLPTNTLSVGFQGQSTNLNSIEYVGAANVAGVTTNIKLPTKTVSVTHNGEDKGSFKICTPDGSDKTLTLQHNYVTIPATTTTPVESDTITIKPVASKQVYHVECGNNTATALTLYLKFDFYGYSYNNVSNIYSAEVHIKNTNSANASISVSGTWVTNLGGGWQTRPLTDRTTIDGRHTSVYVFRFDCAQKTITYSLAYEYENNPNISS